MRKTIFICLLLAPFISTAQTANEIMSKMLERMQEHESVSYTATFEISANTPGKQIVSGLVHLYRDDRDKALGGMAWLSEGIKYDTYSFYDLKKRYVVLNSIHKAWIEKMPVTNTMGLSLLSDKLIYRPFLNCKYWEQTYKEAKLKKLNDTTINGKTCYVIQRDIDHGAGKMPGVETTYLDKSDHFPILTTWVEHYGDKTEYSRLEITNYQLDKVGIEQFDVSQIPASYTKDSRDRETPKGAQPQVRPAEEWPVRRR